LLDHHRVVSKITHRLNFERTQEMDLKRTLQEKFWSFFKWHELDDERATYLAPYMPPDDSVQRNEKTEAAVV